jgi:opacity protein-like surface antigen
MKRTLLLAISVMALTAASQPLFAAEAETPAPRERAPAAARERAPAAQRQARPAQAAPSQTSTSSFTGSQAGGFGGGNVGGGSFADPIPLCHDTFGPTTPFPCPAVPYNYSASHRVNGTGGAFYSYSIPLFGWAVIGLQGEVAFGSIRSSSTQSNTHIDPTLTGNFTAETYSSSFNQSTNGSVLVKIGVPVSIPLGAPLGVISKDPYPLSTSSKVMIYGIVGPTFAKVESDYTYTGSNFGSGSGCLVAFTSCATNAYGTAHFSQTRTGIAGGIGAEWAFMPGVNLRLEYRYTAFGDISQDVPVALVPAGGGACPVGSICATTAHIDIKNLNFQTVRLGVGFGF